MAQRCASVALFSCLELWTAVAAVLRAEVTGRVSRPNARLIDCSGSFEFATSTLACELITHVAYVALVVVLFRLMWRSCPPEVLAAVRLAVGARHRPPPSW